MHFYDSPKGGQNCLFWLYLGSFGHARASGDMVGRCMPNSGRGGCSGERVMTIFVSHVGPHLFLLLDILKYMKVYGGYLRYVEIV